MNAIHSPRILRNRQSGMTLIELMIAMIVLVVGMLALMILVTTAISTNNRNKLDTTGTMLAETVLDRIATLPADQNPTFTMNDCNPAGPTTWNIATAAGGANVDGSGNINFGQAYSSVTPNYAMQYVTCGAGGGQATYDVRWNIRSLTTFTKLVTVSARQIGVPAAGGNLLFFSPPITLRTIAGQ